VNYVKAAVGERQLRVENRPLNFGACWEAPSIRELLMNTFGHSSRELESTVRYLGIEVDDALEMAEQTGV
jgi:hypothetical protein